MKTPIVKLQQFIQAIRDAGYRGTGAALSELIDNAFEAGAKNVRIEIELKSEKREQIGSIRIADDGCGMSAEVLEAALQFGGSSRFGSREGTGRFGMGLPNSSVSQARRVEVYSWERRGAPLWSVLDIDEIVKGTCEAIPRPVAKKLPGGCSPIASAHGTIVVWSECDRLNPSRPSFLIQRLQQEIGRIFRYALWGGRRITINGQDVRPRDPLFLREGSNLQGARRYGPEVKYLVKVYDTAGRPATSTVLVRFAELPIEEWYTLPNEEKRRQGISKKAGVSILRAGREIDYGWYFMRGKRKENYDDWWRCEVEFQPDLDELFGVTHTKQEINPTDQITELLAPDFEEIAHKLNSNVRQRFIRLKPNWAASSERIASEKDAQFEPPRRAVDDCRKSSNNAGNRPVPITLGSAFKLEGLKYRLVVRDLASPDFFTSQLDGPHLTVTLNKLHPFFERMCRPLTEGDGVNAAVLRQQVELLILAAARAETGLETRTSRTVFQQFRSSWSDLLAAFLA
ncbi:MAG: ATP-binding protein [Candidatus Omnitrophica bacterium]|nr:ATP-binding protein [Candidatus Omnitrophota bacterium]